MKKLSKSILSLFLIILLLSSLSLSALATYTVKWAQFPTQSISSYNSYTYGLQAILNCYSTGTFKALGGVDGIFGSGTQSAVIIYQLNEGLASDGIVGSATWQQLWGNLSYRNTTSGYANYYVSQGYSTNNVIARDAYNIKTATYWYAYVSNIRVFLGAV